jgi:hypothetical protein
MLSFATLSLAFVGCGESNGPQGKLHGKVSYKGNPVPAGTSVSLVGDNGAAVTTTDASGNYAMATTVRTGQYTVVVTPASKPMSPEEAMKASMGGKKVDDAASFPAKYRQPGTSPAKVEVKTGDSEYNLDMTDQ